MSEEMTDEIKGRHDEKLPQVDESVVKQNDPTDDRRPGMTEMMFERDVVIDVLSGVPEGHSIDQTLGLGPDGAPIDTTRNHYGVGDDDLLTGRSTNSPRDMARDNLFGTDAGTKDDAPPGIQTGSSNPNRNMDLVSGKDGGTDDRGPLDKAADWLNEKLGGGSDPKPDAGTVRPEGDTPVPKPKPKGTVQPGSEDDYMTNPDADTGGSVGTVTDADVERAIAKQGFDTDFVEGFGRGPAVSGDAPTRRPIDLVRDPVDDDQGSGAVIVTAVGTDPGPLPQDEISRPVNPGDGLPTPTTPPPGSGGPGSGGPGSGGQPGTGGDNVGMVNLGSISAPPSGAIGTAFELDTQTGDHSLELESFSVEIDSSMQMLDSLDSVFDGGLAPQQQQQQQQDGVGEPFGDGGF